MSSDRFIVEQRQRSFRRPTRWSVAVRMALVVVALLVLATSVFAQGTPPAPSSADSHFAEWCDYNRGDPTWYGTQLDKANGWDGTNYGRGCKDWPGVRDNPYFSGGVVGGFWHAEQTYTLTQAQFDVLQGFISAYGWPGVAGSGCGPVRSLCAADPDAMAFIFGFMALLPVVAYAMAVGVGAIFATVWAGARGGRV